jgi:O-methyltransferase domain
MSLSKEAQGPADLSCPYRRAIELERRPAVKRENCRTAMGPDCKLLVIEMTIPDDNHPTPAQLFDLNMLVMTGGQERTVREYGSLFARQNFRLKRVIPTGSPFHLLEAVAV